MKNNGEKIGIIGCGMVGMSFAYQAVGQGICNELVLINRNKDKAIGEAMDLNHGLSFTQPMKIYAGEYEDLKDCDIILITSGVAKKDASSRLELIDDNYRIIKETTEKIMESGFNGIIIIASNPVDILSYVVWKTSGLPKEKVIGTGTILDTARLKFMLGEYLDISPLNVHAFIMGEHGDSEFPVWSNASVYGKNLNDLTKMFPQYKLNDIYDIGEKVKNVAYRVIEKKGATYYAIGLSIATLCKTILKNENALYTVSALCEGEYGVNELYIGVPAIINRHGIRQIVKFPLNDKEKGLLQNSANELKEILKKL